MGYETPLNGPMCVSPRPTSARAQVRARSVRISHMERRGAAVLIQRRVRRFLAIGGRKRRERAAVALQSAWRGYVQRTRWEGRQIGRGRVEGSLPPTRIDLWPTP